MWAWSVWPKTNCNRCATIYLRALSDQFYLLVIVSSMNSIFGREQIWCRRSWGICILFLGSLWTTEDSLTLFLSGSLPCSYRIGFGNGDLFDPHSRKACPHIQNRILSCLVWVSCILSWWSRACFWERSLSNVSPFPFLWVFLLNMTSKLCRFHNSFRMALLAQAWSFRLPYSTDWNEKALTLVLEADRPLIELVRKARFQIDVL
jgi:hypothetical protein